MLYCVHKLFPCLMRGITFFHFIVYFPFYHMNRDGGVLFEVGGLSAEHTISERRRRETSRGSGGMLPRKILKSRVSEMPFPALWGQNLQNSNGQKTTYNMSKFTCSLDRIIFQNVITGAVFVVNTLCNWFLIILTTPTLHEKAAKHKPYNASVLTS